MCPTLPYYAVLLLTYISHFRNDFCPKSEKKTNATLICDDYTHFRQKKQQVFVFKTKIFCSKNAKQPVVVKRKVVCHIFKHLNERKPNDCYVNCVGVSKAYTY